MKNLLESIVFDRNRFKKLAGINENVSGAVDYPPEAAANDLEKQIDRFNESDNYGFRDEELKKFLIEFLTNAAAKLGKKLPGDIDNKIEVEYKDSKDDGFGEYTNSGEVNLRGIQIATWSSRGDGSYFSVNDFNKANFKKVYEQLFDLK